MVAMGVGTTIKGSWQEAGGVQEVLGNTDGTCTTRVGEEDAVVVPRGRRGTVCEGRGSGMDPAKGVGTWTTGGSPSWELEPVATMGEVVDTTGEAE